MLAVLMSLAPIAAILVLGKASASVKLLSAEGWIGLERITYFVLFPALIVSKLAVADFSDVDWRMPTVLIGAQVTLGVLSIILGLVFGQGRDRLGVFVQSAVRWNTFIALALAQELMGPQGLALVAVAAAAMIPTANILSVVALMQFSGTPVNFGKLLKNLAVNPLVLACVIGLALNVTRLPIPSTLNQVLDLLAQATIDRQEGARCFAADEYMPCMLHCGIRVPSKMFFSLLAQGLARHQEGESTKKRDKLVEEDTEHMNAQVLGTER